MIEEEFELSCAGLIERYRDRLPFAPGDPVVSLDEGSTPLVPAPRALRARRRRGVAEDRGREPDRLVQGPRHDRARCRRAVREGAEAVICASTGNTAASAAAYAARAGLRGAVIVPEGKIATRQARPGADARRARDRAARQLRRGARRSCASSSQRHPIALVNSVNPFRLEGQKTAAFEIVDELGEAPDALCIPVGNAGNITAYWKGFQEYGAAPRMLGFQAEGAAPLVHGAPVEQPETVASAIRIGNPARWEEAMDAMTASRGAVRGGVRRARSSTPTAARRARGRLLRAGVGRVASPGCSSTAPRAPSGSSACSPATG